MKPDKVWIVEETLNPDVPNGVLGVYRTRADAVKMAYATARNYGGRREKGRDTWIDKRVEWSIHVSRWNVL